MANVLRLQSFTERGAQQNGQGRTFTSSVSVAICGSSISTFLC
ncbi:SapB/AmfS family lanthipeptide [Prescottella equi]